MPLNNNNKKEIISNIRNWKEIHPDFTSELQKEWETNGLDYEEHKNKINNYENFEGKEQDAGPSYKCKGCPTIEKGHCRQHYQHGNEEKDYAKDENKCLCSESILSSSVYCWNHEYKYKCYLDDCHRKTTRNRFYCSQVCQEIAQEKAKVLQTEKNYILGLNLQNKKYIAQIFAPNKINK